jgi:hypothetical protein
MNVTAWEQSKGCYLSRMRSVFANRPPSVDDAPTRAPARQLTPAFGPTDGTFRIGTEAFGRWPLRAESHDGPV